MPFLNRCHLIGVIGATTVLLLAACGSPTATPTTSPGGGTTAAPSAASSSKLATYVSNPCEALTQAEVEAVVGQPESTGVSNGSGSCTYTPTGSVALETVVLSMDPGPVTQMPKIFPAIKPYSGLSGSYCGETVTGTTLVVSAGSDSRGDYYIDIEADSCAHDASMAKDVLSAVGS